MTARYVFVSTYPPTHCGLATFTASLSSELRRLGDIDTAVVRLLDESDMFDEPGDTVARIVAGDGASLATGLEALNAGDLAIVQHEFGVYGGLDGDEVLALIDGLRVPSIVVLHTVPLTPTPRQRAIIESLAAQASWCVVLSSVALQRLEHGYDVDMARAGVIVHGAPVIEPTGGADGVSAHDGRPVVLTWGLLGPGKGIEWGIAALSQLQDLDPAPRYLVAGQTHPKVVARDGETYRTSLIRQAEELSLADAVEFDGRYRDSVSLAALVRTADVVLLPYDSVDQVTSGVLIEALAAGRPVVATAFPHAVEMLESGAGVVVPHQDPDSIARALRRVLTDHAEAAAMSAAAGRQAPAVSWTTVARQYHELAQRLVTAGVPA